MKSANDRLAEINRELQEANVKWLELKARLVAHGDEPISLSEELFDSIEAGAKPRLPFVPPMHGLRA
jgi:hypothetical protein